jgi:hypothetical protein
VDLIKKLLATSKFDPLGSRWTLIDRAAFALHVANIRGNRRRIGELVALVSSAERGRLSAGEQRHCMSLSQFASKCKRLLLSEGLAGVCGQ